MNAQSSPAPSYDPSKIGVRALMTEQDNIIVQFSKVAHFFYTRLPPFNTEGSNISPELKKMYSALESAAQSGNKEAEALIIQTLTCLGNAQDDSAMLTALNLPTQIVSDVTIFPEKMSFVLRTASQAKPEKVRQAARIFLSVVDYMKQINAHRGPALNAILLQAYKSIPSQNPAAKLILDTLSPNREGLEEAHRYFTELFFTGKNRDQFYPIFQLFIQGSDKTHADAIIAENLQALHDFFDDLSLFIALIDNEPYPTPERLSSYQHLYPDAFERAKKCQPELFPAEPAKNQDETPGHIPEDHSSNNTSLEDITTADASAPHALSTASSISSLSDDEGFITASEEEPSLSDASTTSLDSFVSTSSQPPEPTSSAKTSPETPVEEKKVPVEEKKVPVEEKKNLRDNPFSWLFTGRKASPTAQKPSPPPTTPWYVVIGSLLQSLAQKISRFFSRFFSPKPPSSPTNARDHPGLITTVRHKIIGKKPRTEDDIKQELDLSIAKIPSRKKDMPTREVQGFREIRPKPRSHSDPTPSRRKKK